MLSFGINWRYYLISIFKNFYFSFQKICCQSTTSAIFSSMSGSFHSPTNLYINLGTFLVSYFIITSSRSHSSSCLAARYFRSYCHLTRHTAFSSRIFPGLYCSIPRYPSVQDTLPTQILIL